MRKGLPTSNMLCPSKVFLHHAVEHKAHDMSYQLVKHSSNSISNTFCRSSPNGWSFGAWRIQGVIFFQFELPTFQTQQIFYSFSIIFKPSLFSLYWFFFFTMVIFFKQPYISNNRIFQWLYSFNINSIISSLIFITLTQ